MIRGDLPPVGNTILTKPSTIIPSFDGFDAFYVDSGTSALALAIIAAKQLQPEIAKPEVIVPAYCCPDLVSAAVYADTQVIVVDISPDDPAYDLEQLGEAINSNTIAVIAVNFLGIKERLAEIKNLLPSHCHLIEDNAQNFEPLQAPEQLVGDMVITSFGRGKPVSLLGGGLCLVKEKLNQHLALINQIQPAQKSSLLKAKIIAYNGLINPALYPLINRNPLLSIGETCYKSLAGICALDQQRLAWLSSNIQAYDRQNTSAQQALNDMFSKSKHVGLKSLALASNPRCGKALRYPVLCQSENIRDQLLVALNRKGLGATAMYQRPLVDIPFMRELTKGGGRTAACFSRRLITLPCHPSVTHHDVEKINLGIATVMNQINH